MRTPLKTRATVLAIASLAFVTSPLLSAAAVAASNTWTFLSGVIATCPGGNDVARTYVAIQNPTTVWQTVTVRIFSGTSPTLYRSSTLTIAPGTASGAGWTGTTHWQVTSVRIEIVAATDRILPTADTCDETAAKDGTTSTFGFTTPKVYPGQWRVIGPQGGIDSAVLATQATANTTLGSVQSLRTEVASVRTDGAATRTDVATLRTRIIGRPVASCNGGLVERGRSTAQLFLDIVTEGDASTMIMLFTDKGPVTRTIATQSHVPVTFDVNQFLASSSAGALAQELVLKVYAKVASGSKAVTLTCRQFYAGSPQGTAGAVTAAVILPTVAG